MRGKHARGVRKGANMPAGLGRGNMLCGAGWVWLGLVRLGSMSCDLASSSILRVVNH